MDTSNLPLQGWEKTIDKTIHPPKPESTTTLGYPFMVAGAMATLAAAFLHRKSSSPLLKRIALLVAPTTFALGLYLNKRTQPVKKNALTLEGIRATWEEGEIPKLATIGEKNPELTAEQRAFLIREDLFEASITYSAIVKKHSDKELSKLFDRDQNPEYRNLLKQKYLHEVTEKAAPGQVSPYSYDLHPLSSFPNLGVTTAEYEAAYRKGLTENQNTLFFPNTDSVLLDVKNAIRWRHWDSLWFALQEGKLEPSNVPELITASFPLELEYLLNNWPSTWETSRAELINNTASYDLSTIAILAKQPEFDWSNSRGEDDGPPLAWICCSQSPEAAELVTTALNQPNVNSNCRAGKGHSETTPLLSAIDVRNSASIRALVTHPTNPADPNLAIGSSSPLQKAVKCMNKEVLAALLMAPGLEKKGDAFFEAIKSSNVAAVAALLEDLTFTPSKNPLPVAIMGGVPNQKVVNLLWNSPRIDKSVTHYEQTMEVLAKRYSVTLP